MDKRKLRKQIITLVLLVLMFVLFDLCIYCLFTRVYKNNTSPEMQAKSVELDKYLPFEENFLHQPSSPPNFPLSCVSRDPYSRPQG